MKVGKGIYKITNLSNGKVYVGQTVNFHVRKNTHWRQLKEGIHKNTHLQSSWRKYGENSFSFEPLEYVDNRCSLDRRESYWIDYFNSINPSKGYNKRIDPQSNKGIHIGEDHPLTHLTWEDVKEIRREFLNKTKTKKQLAKFYSVCRSTIKHIVYNKTWVDKEYNPRTVPFKIKLSYDVADEIRQKMSTGKYKQKELAEEYDINKNNISLILKGKIWKRVA